MGVWFSPSSRAARTAGGCAALVVLGAVMLASPSADAGDRRAAAAASWRDDFDTLDPNTWNVIERDCFDPANVTVSSGKLRMTIARSARTDCAGVTGARINTYGLRQFGPGTFEARIKFVLAPGSWQTFWLTGARNVAFPANGEIDIAGIIGRTPTNTHVALHSAFQTGGAKRCDVGAAPTATVDRVWHAYGVRTSSTRVTFTIDRTTIASFTPGSTCTWPFGDPMRVLLSSRGGKYGGEVVPSAYPIT